MRVESEGGKGGEGGCKVGVIEETANDDDAACRLIRSCVLLLSSPSLSSSTVRFLRLLLVVGGIAAG